MSSNTNNRGGGQKSVRLKGGGVEAAAKMLTGLPPKDRERILNEMGKHDPKITERIKQNLYSLEDICYLTPNMIRSLLQVIPLRVLGLALRMAPEKVLEHLKKSISKNVAADLQSYYQGTPEPVELVQRAREQVLAVIRTKVQKGELILDKNASDQFV